MRLQAREKSKLHFNNMFSFLWTLFGKISIKIPRWLYLALTAIAVVSAAYWIGSSRNADMLEKTRQQLLTCQQEQITDKKKIGGLERQMDTLAYTGKMLELKQQIARKNEQIQDLLDKRSRDSIAHLSQLQALRAIIDYHKKGERGRLYSPG